MMVIRNNSALSSIVILLSVVLSAGCASDISPLGVGTVDPENSSEPADNADIASGADTATNSGADTSTPNTSEQNSTDTNPTTDNNQTTELPPESAFAQAAIENAALLYIAETEGPTGLSVTSRARFYSVTTPLSNDPVLKSMPMLDTCEIGSESSQINASALDRPIDHLLQGGGNEILQVSAVSAGDTVELASDAGSFVSLLKMTAQGAIEYAVQDGTSLNMNVPDALNMNVTGDAFPQLTTTWTTPSRLDSGIHDAVRSIDSGSVLTWTASATQDSVQSRLHIYAGFLDELTGEYKSYQCELADDGEFALPADVQALYEGGLVANFVDVARYTRSVQLVNGISVVNVFVQSF